MDLMKLSWTLANQRVRAIEKDGEKKREMNRLREKKNHVQYQIKHGRSNNGSLDAWIATDAIFRLFLYPNHISTIRGH